MALASPTVIQAAVVVVRMHDREQLVLCYEPIAPRQDAQPSLRAQMSALLSTAIILSISVLVDIPLTLTGKKDRKTLVARPKAMDQDNITEMVQTRPANGRPVETNQQRELR